MKLRKVYRQGIVPFLFHLKIYGKGRQSSPRAQWTYTHARASSDGCFHYLYVTVSSKVSEQDLLKAPVYLYIIFHGYKA